MNENKNNNIDIEIKNLEIQHSQFDLDKKMEENKKNYFSKNID